MYPSNGGRLRHGTSTVGPSSSSRPPRAGGSVLSNVGLNRRVGGGGGGGGILSKMSKGAPGTTPSILRHGAASTRAYSTPGASKFASSSAIAAAANPDPDPSLGAIDPFFLDFGSSSIVEDDLRDALKNECKTIDKSIAELRSGAKSEQATRSRVLKDLNHGKDEMSMLAQGAREMIENGTMRKETMLGMDEIIRKEILAAVVGRGDDDFIESDGVDGTDGADGMEAEEGDDATIENGVIEGAGVEDPGSPQCVSKVDCGESYVLSRKAEFESMMSKGLASREYLHEGLSVVSEKNAHRNQVVRRMRENRLEETKEELEANVNKLVGGIQDLAEEERSLRDELQAARDTCGNDAMKISSLNKDLADVKQVNMEKEREKHDYLMTLNTEKSIQESELTTDQSTINELQAEIEKLEECFREIDSFLSEKSETNARLEKLSSEKNHHKTELCSLKTTDEKEMLESLKNTKDSFDTTFKEHEDFVNLRKTNDEGESIIKEQKQKSEDIEQEKQRLVKEMSSLHEQSVKSQNDLTKELTNEEQVAKDLSALFKESTYELETAKLELEKIETGQKQEKESKEKKLSDQKSDVINQKSEFEKLQKAMQELEDKNKEEEEKRINEKKTELEGTRQFLEYKLKVVEKAAGLIEEAGEMEKLAKEPIEADDESTIAGVAGPLAVAQETPPRPQLRSILRRTRSQNSKAPVTPIK